MLFGKLFSHSLFLVIIYDKPHKFKKMMDVLLRDIIALFRLKWIFFSLKMNPKDDSIITMVKSKVCEYMRSKGTFLNIERKTT